MPVATNLEMDNRQDTAEPWLICCLTGLLLTCRWMLPVESATLGDTLWLAQCTLLLPLIWAIRSRKPGTKSVVWGTPDVCVWSIVIGHWMSFVWLVTNGGQLRAALNLCWEWTAIGCMVFALRQCLQSSVVRSDLVRLVLVLGISMAGIGLWQHFIAYRYVQAEYQAMQTNYDQLAEKAESGTLSRIEQQQLNALELEFQELGVPTEGASREVFERRLADNRQPVGRWALTNSLGGLLAVVMVLLLASIVSSSERPVLGLMVLLIVGLCLWATQSRTAHVATLIGIGWLSIERLVSPGKIRRFRLFSMVVLVLAGGLVLSYGFSRMETISYDSNYALRSLQFRLQYWWGSLRALWESPLFGTGPGNFRQVYLQHKLAASSERITDPHNAVLDVWANGGLVAVSALISAAGVTLRRYWISPQENTNESPQSAFNGWLSSPWFFGAELALLGLLLWNLMTVGFLDWELVILMLVVPLLDVGLTPLAARLSRQHLRISLLVLGLHLMGAGGMEMPGIVLLSMSLWAVSRSDTEPCCQMTRGRQVLMVVVSLGMPLTMWFNTTQPVWQSSTAMEQANRSWMIDGRANAARESFREAALSDPYSPEPWRLLAELEFALWTHESDNLVAFERAMSAWSEASRRDPESSQDHLRRAMACWEVSQRTDSQELAAQAVVWYERANQKMPHDEQILSGLAEAAHAAGFPKKSKNAAKAAITVDELSRKNGHWEKTLTETVRARMEELAAQ